MISEYKDTRKRGEVLHSPTYFENLVKRLRKKYPERNIVRTYAMDMLVQVAKDVKDGKAPFEDVGEVYRDVQHLNFMSGRYLVHNSMRYALGQPFSSRGFEELDSSEKMYLDGLLWSLNWRSESIQKNISKE